MLKFPLKTALAALLLLPAISGASEEKDIIFQNLPYPIEVKLPAPQKAGAVLFESQFSEVPALEYDTVLLQGEISSPELRIDLVLGTADGRTGTGSYQPETVHRFPTGRFWARYSVGGLTRRPLKFSVVDTGAETGATLTIFGTDLLRSASMREVPEVQLSTVPYVPDPALSAPETVPFKLVRRAGWKAAAPKEPYLRHAPAYFTIHHTEAHYPKNYAESVAEIQFIQDFHQNGRGWIDIGYHFLIDPFGNIFEGRPINVVGAHVKNRNTGNIGISIMGNYQAPVSSTFTPETQNSFVAVGTYLKDTYTVNRSSFYAHRDLEDTTCPGDELYAKMGMLRGLIFTPQPVPVQPPPGGPAPLAPEQSRSLRQLMDYFGN